MSTPKSIVGDLQIEFIKGNKHCGGQHRNSTNSACRITHLPTGISAFCDDRNQHTSKKKARTVLERRLKDAEAEEKAKDKKAHRDWKIHNMETVRTYHYVRGVVKDHRTGKTASLKEVLEKGNLDLLK